MKAKIHPLLSTGSKDIRLFFSTKPKDVSTKKEGPSPTKEKKVEQPTQASSTPPQAEEPKSPLARCGKVLKPRKHLILQTQRQRGLKKDQKVIGALATIKSVRDGNGTSVDHELWQTVESPEDWKVIGYDPETINQYQEGDGFLEKTTQELPKEEEEKFEMTKVNLYKFTKEDPMNEDKELNAIRSKFKKITTEEVDGDAPTLEEDGTPSGSDKEEDHSKVSTEDESEDERKHVEEEKELKKNERKIEKRNRKFRKGKARNPYVDYGAEEKE